MDTHTAGGGFDTSTLMHRRQEPNTSNRIRSARHRRPPSEKALQRPIEPRVPHTGPPLAVASSPRRPRPWHGHENGTPTRNPDSYSHINGSESILPERAACRRHARRALPHAPPWPSCGHCIGFGTADEDAWCPTAQVVSDESRRTHANLIGRRGHE